MSKGHEHCNYQSVILWYCNLYCSLLIIPSLFKVFFSQTMGFEVSIIFSIFLCPATQPIYQSLADTVPADYQYSIFHTSFTGQNINFCRKKQVIFLFSTELPEHIVTFSLLWCLKPKPKKVNHINNSLYILCIKVSTSVTMTPFFHISTV